MQSMSSSSLSLSLTQNIIIPLSDFLRAELWLELASGGHAFNGVIGELLEIYADFATPSSRVYAMDWRWTAFSWASCERSRSP